MGMGTKGLGDRTARESPRVRGVGERRMGKMDRATNGGAKDWIEEQQLNMNRSTTELGNDYIFI